MLETVREVFALRRNGYSGPFFIGLILFVVGVQLLLPNDTFSTSNSYRVMEEWATSQGWGLFMAACGVLLVTAALRRRPEIVSLGAVVAGFAWLIVTVSVGMANPEGILFPIVGVMVLRCMSLYKEFKTQFDPVTGNPYPHYSNRE